MNELLTLAEWCRELARSYRYQYCRVKYAGEPLGICTIIGRNDELTGFQRNILLDAIARLPNYMELDRPFRRGFKFTMDPYYGFIHRAEWLEKFADGLSANPVNNEDNHNADSA